MCSEKREDKCEVRVSGTGTVSETSFGGRGEAYFLRTSRSPYLFGGTDAGMKSRSYSGT